MVLTMRVSLLKSTMGKVLAHLSASMVDRLLRSNNDCR